MRSVTIIGIGRVGGAFGFSLPTEEFRVDSLFVRSVGPAVEAIVRRTGASVRADSSYESISSDIVLIASQDSEIAGIDRELASRLRTKPLVLHTSGSFSSKNLPATAKIGCPTGSIHPLVSVSRPELGPERLPNAYFCIEGTDAAIQVATAIANALGGIPFSVPTDRKTLYHAAAVTACGHFVALIDMAVEMMSMCGLTPEFSKEILMPLVASTADNLKRQTAGEALTGTFARADIDTFTRHVTILNECASQDTLELYLLLGERSLELAANQGVSPERIERLRAKVAIAKSKLK
jgi:predicted short-subunit dehydrogenase-like oxidoreductase (DUF2520 family)